MKKLLKLAGEPSKLMQFRVAVRSGDLEKVRTLLVDQSFKREDLQLMIDKAIKCKQMKIYLELSTFLRFKHEQK